MQLAAVDGRLDVPPVVKQYTTRPVLHVHLREVKTGVQANTCTLMFTAEFSLTAKRWKQPECSSTDEWLNELWSTHRIEYYSAIKRNEILPFVTTWIDLEDIRLSELSWIKTNTV